MNRFSLFVWLAYMLAVNAFAIVRDSPGPMLQIKKRQNDAGIGASADGPPSAIDANAVATTTSVNGGLGDVQTFATITTTAFGSSITVTEPLGVTSTCTNSAFQSQPTIVILGDDGDGQEIGNQCGNDCESGDQASTDCQEGCDSEDEGGDDDDDFICEEDQNGNILCVPADDVESDGEFGQDSLGQDGNSIGQDQESGDTETVTVFVDPQGLQTIAVNSQVDVEPTPTVTQIETVTARARRVRRLHLH